MEGIELVYNEQTGAWEPRKEPYAVIELDTKEAFDELMDALEFYREHKKKEGKNG